MSTMTYDSGGNQSGGGSLGEQITNFISSSGIAVFSKSWCPYCKKAKDLLDKYGTPYKVWELDLEANGDLVQAKLLEISGQKTVPNIYINKKHIGGFSDLKSLDDAGALKALVVKEESNYLNPGEQVTTFINSNAIALFSKSWCPYCKKAKELLDRYGTAYKVWEIDLEGDESSIQRSLSEMSGQKTVPNIFINGNHIGGFSDLSALHEDGRLKELINVGRSSDSSNTDSKIFVNRIEEFVKGNQIAIFSKSWCPWCSKAKALLAAQGNHFQAWELDLDDDGVKIQAKLHEISGQNTVPNIFINGEHIGGFSDLSHYDTAGLLDELLAKQDLDFEYDLIVIGGGSGGISAAKEAAAAKKKVALCDFVTPSPRGTVWGLGGTCVNVGCIPKKLMHRAAIIRQDMKDAIDFGWKLPGDILDITHDWGTMCTNIQTYISSLNDQYIQQLQANNVTFYNAKASLLDKHTVRMVDRKGLPREVKAKNIIIAVGGRPSHLDLPNAKELCITSDDIFSLKHPPGKTLVIGASYIALECAGFLKGLGYDVTVMVRSILLRGFDQECATKIEKYMTDYGVKFLKECVPTSVEKYTEEDGKSLTWVKGQFNSGDHFEGMFDTVLVAVGRTALTKELNLDSVGIEVNPRNQKIVVNEKDQTSVKNVFAVGDVIERPELTPVAILAGKLLAKRLYKSGTELMDYKNIATTVFTPLEYGCIGLNEEEAIAQHGKENIEVYHSTFTPLESSLRSWGTEDTNNAFAKLICVKEQKEEYVIGLHILSPNAGEITQGFALGVRLRLTKAQFDGLVGIHPTVAEVFTTLKVTKSSGEESTAKGC
uniref:thioredoxin-disulfide reductase (NADPH) n=2 Tax=Lygus hesperus TaxID=30085 RepID=A0A146MC08_LYGHE